MPFRVFIWWEGGYDDWRDEVDVKLDCGHRTMSATGRMGIISGQSWKKRRMTMKFLNVEVYQPRGGLADVGSGHNDDAYFMVWEKDWRQCLAMAGGALWIQKRCKAESRLMRRVGTRCWKTCALLRCDVRRAGHAMEERDKCGTCRKTGGTLRTFCNSDENELQNPVCTSGYDREKCRRLER